MIKQLKSIIVGDDINGQRRELEVGTFNDNTLKSEVEGKAIELAKQNNIIEFTVWSKFPDGSGAVAKYKKNGEAWVRLAGDNLVPDWFAVTAGVVIFVIPVVIIFSCIIYGLVTGNWR